MEGVVQYRLLGSHPAASGRYLTMGFAGATTTLRALLQRIAAEHQVNADRYKLEVVRVTSDAAAAAAAASMTYGDDNNTTSNKDMTRLSDDDVLRTYDRLVIHVSRRQLSDDAAVAAARRVAEQARHLREAEAQLQHGMLTSSRHRHLHLLDNDDDDDDATTTGRLLPSLSLATRPRDARELERAARLANKTLPVRPRTRSATAPPSDADATTTTTTAATTCVLCDLPPYDAVYTPCCRLRVCRTCLQSARLMMRASSDAAVCPVCGSVRTATTTMTTAASADGDDDVALAAAAVTTSRARDERKFVDTLPRTPATSAVSVCNDRKGSSNHSGTTQTTRPNACGTRRSRDMASHDDDDNGDSNVTMMTTTMRPSSELTPSMRRCERRLCTRLDTLLALLDVPEPPLQASPHCNDDDDDVSIATRVLLQQQ